MNLKGLFRTFAQVLLLSLAVLLSQSGMGDAQQVDIDQVKATMRAYQAALSSLDLAKMAQLWVHDEGVMLAIPPNKSISVGWNAVQKNMQATYGSDAALVVTPLHGPYVRVQGDVAWSAGVLNAAVKLKTGASFKAPVFETNVFVNRGGRWLFVSHIVTPVPK